MIIISNKGNLAGPSKNANALKQIEVALSHDFDVLIEVFSSEKGFFLDAAKLNKIPIDFLRKHVDRLWIRAMDFETLNFFNTEESDPNCFYLNDNYSLTSHQHVIVMPGNKIPEYGVACFPETDDKWDISNAFAACSDFPLDLLKGKLPKTRKPKKGLTFV